MIQERILVADDDAPMRHMLKVGLEYAGYLVLVAPDGIAALEAVADHDVSLIVLDIMMPGRDGLSVLREVRRTRWTPVIMLTARGDIQDRITAFSEGADDYVCKPFSPRELEARIAAILRRIRASEVATAPVKLGDSRQMLPASREVVRGSHRIRLTEMEYGLLELLVSNPGRTFTRSEILHHVWGYRMSHYADSRVVDAHVARLRSKLESNPAAPNLIVSNQGVGYSFNLALA